MIGPNVSEPEVESSYYLQGVEAAKLGVDAAPEELSGWKLGQWMCGWSDALMQYALV